MKWIYSLSISLLASCGPAFAVGGGGEQGVTVVPTFTQNGNTWRITATTPTAAAPVLLSSAAARAVVKGSDTLSLGIQIYRERYVINLCTAAALALLPSNALGFTVFSSSLGVIISSAGAGTAWVTPNNSRYFYHQDEIWGIWDTGSNNGAIGPTPPCAGGAVVTESYFSASDDPTKRR